MRPYSHDLRQRILAAVERRELTFHQIAHHFQVSVSCIVRLLQRYHLTGSCHPQPHAGGRPPKMDKGAQKRLQDLVSQQPDATLTELRDRLGISCSLTTIFRTLKRLGITRKKKVLYDTEGDTPRVRQQRRRYRKRMSQVKASRLVFFDEMGATTAMTRRYGRAPRGQRVVDRVPVHGTNRTLVVGLRLSGVRAAIVLPRAMNRDSFEGYVRDFVVPVLREGDVVIWDRLAAHQNPAVMTLVKRAGATVVMLPVSSPDLNPIEEMFSKLKSWLRTVGARTVPKLLDAIGEGLRRVTGLDIRGWFQHRAPYAMPA
jgi:transposase